uniref:Cationic amino acid transporter C-terminal domain-containing protein n=1 Tax=Ananas comosus var. bracteatus TaxID=296719 RepID=A0A6V7NMB1_ANACO|nr:unnamed protein product [Ananas comosus var. bracteatus]
MLRGAHSTTYLTGGRWGRRGEEGGGEEEGVRVLEGGFSPGGVVRELGELREGAGETGRRLRDRIVTRSAESEEMHEVRARSGHEMKKTLTWFDLIFFGIGAVIGAGIFVLTGQEANEVVGPAVVLSYVVSGVSAMLSVFCYTEFAVEIPVAGGSFAYLRVELGDFVAFIAAGNILLEYVIGGAAVARSWTSYFATLLNHQPADFRIHAHSLAADYNQLDPIAVAVIAIVCIAASLSTKGSSRFNYIASIIHLVVILFIIVAGLTKADTHNLSPSPLRAPRHLRLRRRALLRPYGQIDKDAPFSVAFQKVGMNWAKYIVAFGALKGMTTVLLVSAVGQARYLTHIARTHMMPPWLAQVHPRTGTPVNATIVMLVATAVIAFFTDLGILSNLLSISTLFIFMVVALALLVRRYYVAGETSDANRSKLVACLVLILASSIATAAYWGVSAKAKGWAAYVVTVPVWFLATLYLAAFVPKARQPKLWGVPLVPWLPSASIAINVFLLGSIDSKSFMRFGIWSAFLLLYYLFVGLHASYDTAKAAERSRNDGKAKELEEGVGLADASHIGGEK